MSCSYNKDNGNRGSYYELRPRPLSWVSMDRARAKERMIFYSGCDSCHQVVWLFSRTYNTNLPKIGCSGFMVLAVTSWKDSVPTRIVFREKAKWSFFHNKQQRVATTILTATSISTAPPAGPLAACTAHRRRLSSPSSYHAHSNTTMSMRAWCGYFGQKRKPLWCRAVIRLSAAVKSPLRYIGRIPVCNLIVLFID